MFCQACTIRPATECRCLCYWCHEGIDAPKNTAEPVRPSQARTAHRLVAVVRDHGYPARITGGNATLRVASRNVTSAGKAFWHVETIAATDAGVCDWLGY